MEWLGLTPDEGPYYQSERSEVYAVALARLLAGGHAYRCTCTTEELEAQRTAAKAAGKGFAYNRHCRPGMGPGPDPDRPATVRFAAPLEGEVTVEDLVKGPIVVRNEEIDDFVIARSDGTPTYQLVVTVDDIDMEISHVIRGDDHLNNTTKQIHIYLALGAELPQFAHLPQVLGKDKGRLSKRHGATDVLTYMAEGYFPDAMVNFLARLGWSHGDQEIFTRDEMVSLFRLEAIGHSPGVFDLEKLDWLNFEYLKARTPVQLAADLREFLALEGRLLPGDETWQAKMVQVFQERARNLRELADSCAYFVDEEIVYQEKAARKHLTEESVALLAELEVQLAALTEWTPDVLEMSFLDLVQRREIKLGQLAQPVRVAMTGGTVSPGIFDVLEILGRERSMARLRRAAAYRA